MKNKNSIKDHNRSELFLLEPRTLFFLISVSLLTLLFYFFQSDARQFLTSVLQPLPEHAPYDGIVAPIKEVPNWSKLTETERKMAYNQLPPEKLIPLPPYNPTELAIPFESLKWGDPSDEVIRNEKVTYAVPYLGNYEMDGKENVGSHPAVDIKVPMGTPVYAIGNGVVTKTQLSNSGFGNHIVIQHSNFPSPSYPGATETLHSTYNHLSQVLVSERQVVVKGQLIGYSGESGLATTPHLHFQIDLDSAPFHPYWPFTTAEINAAGLSFFDALNAGFGIDKARQYTINPMKYLQNNSGITNVSSPPAQEPAHQASPYAFSITVMGAPYIEGGEAYFVIRLTDKQGNILKRESFDDRISVELRSNLGELNRAYLSSGFFLSGESEAVRVGNLKPGKDKLILRFRDEEFTSDEYEIVPNQPSSLASSTQPKLVASATETTSTEQSSQSGNTNFLVLGKTYSIEATTRIPFPRLEVTLDRKEADPGETVNGMVQYFDAYANNVAPTGDVRFYVSIIKGSGALSTDVIKPEDWSAGKFLFTVTPEGQDLTAVQVSGANLWGFSDGITIKSAQITADPTLVFSDIPHGHPLETALTYLKEQGVIKGYTDGSFQEDKPVLRVEALKMIYEALKLSIPQTGTLLFSDLQSGAWYLPVVEQAFRDNVATGYSDGTFKPNAEVKLSEFLKMLFVAAKMDINPDITQTLPSDVMPSDWFAPYIQEAVTLGILDSSQPASPGHSMTRGEIAKALYVLLNR